MTKIIDQQLQEIASLIDYKKWEEVGNILLKLSTTGDSRVYYYLGHIYDAWENPKKDEEKAKKYFSLAAESTNPVASAFIRLSRNERNRTNSIRILRKGLRAYPRSEAIYYQLLSYTELPDREDIYKGIIKEQCLSERIKICMAVTYFDLKEYEKAIGIVSGFEAEEEWDRNVLALINGFSLYEIGKTAEAKKIFYKLIEEDINHRLHFIPHLGIVLILLSQDKLPEAEKLIEEMPLDREIYEDGFGAFNLAPGPWGDSYLDAKDYSLRAIYLTVRKSKNKRIVAIMRGLRGLSLYGDAFDSEPLEKKLQVPVRRDLEYAIKQFPQNKGIAECLFRIFKESSPSKAWYYLKQCILNGSEDLYDIDDFIEDVDARLFEIILKDFADKLKDSYFSQRACKPLLGPIIRRLFRSKKYVDILFFVSKFNDSQIAESDVLFETAYAYYEKDNATASKKYYELCLSRNGESNAVLNNLGLIFEKTGNLLKAKELYQKAAQLNNEDEICRRNLKRVEDELKKKGKLEYDLQEAVEKYRSESPYSHKKFLVFYSHRNEDGLIICSYRQAPQFLKMSATKATDFLNDLLSKKYFIKVTDHKYETQSNVYRLNPYLEPELARIEESLKSEEELLDMCERLSIQSLNLIGYNDDLLRNVAKILSDELRSMLQRDLKENALAVILKQNKSALVLSGSIIEAVLTDRITAKGLTKYKIGNDTKTVLKMDLNELLDVAEKEKVIDSTMAHLAHAVRGYRNLIHPGAEQRKDTIQVNDSNVELAWGIVKKLLNEIK
jgi:tetratricopeptide (TPR) repeat protein